jgi:hypothetical protein
MIMTNSLAPLANAALNDHAVKALPDLEGPAFLDDDDPSADIPPFVTLVNALELFDLRPDETVPEAIARRAAGG